MLKVLPSKTRNKRVMFIFISLFNIVQYFKFYTDELGKRKKIQERKSMILVCGRHFYTYKILKIPQKILKGDKFLKRAEYRIPIQKKFSSFSV